VSAGGGTDPIRQSCQKIIAKHEGLWGRETALRRSAGWRPILQGGVLRAEKHPRRQAGEIAIERMEKKGFASA